MNVAELPVLYSDEDLLLIRKPPGLSFHSQNQETGIVQIIRQMEEKELLPAGERIFPVHRLDRITSGILLFARGRKNANELGNEFRHNRVDKIYTALSARKPAKKMGTVNGDLEKGRGAAYYLKRSKQNPAITHFLTSSANPLFLFLLKPETGQTHQIRVAMKSLGSPILGDPLYNPFSEARKYDRGYLHAMALRFTLRGRNYSFFDLPDSGQYFSGRFYHQLQAMFEDYSGFSWNVETSTLHDLKIWSLKFPGQKVKKNQKPPDNRSEFPGKKDRAGKSIRTARSSKSDKNVRTTKKRNEQKPSRRGRNRP